MVFGMGWVKWKGTTDKVEPSTLFVEEEKISFQRAISKVVLEHHIPPDVVLNLDQTPLSYVSPGKYTLTSKDRQMYPLKADTFVVSAAGVFLSIQLIYTGKSEHSLPKFTFPSSFHVAFAPNHL